MTVDAFMRDVQALRDCPRTIPTASPRRNSPAHPRSSCSRSTWSWPAKYRSQTNCQIALFNCICTISYAALLHRNHCCTDTIMPNRKSPARPRGPRRHPRHRHPPFAQPQPHAAEPQGDCRESSIWCPARRCTLCARSSPKQLVQVDPLTKRYRLGVGMLPLARAVLENSDFPNLVRPKLDDLSSRYGVMAIGVEVPTSTT